MNPQELRDLCQLYALGALDGEELAEMERRLAEDGPEVREAMRDAVIANATIAALAPQVDPPRRLRKKLLAGVGGETSGWSWNFWVVATAALLVAVVWIGVENERKSDELASLKTALSDARTTVAKTQTNLDRVRAALRFLDQPETKLVGFGKGEPAPPHGNVFVNPKNGVLLIASNLPRLQGGKTYQMWVIPKSGKPAPAGVFQSDEAGTAVHLLASTVDMKTTGAVAVTVEPEGGSPQPTSTPIIVAALAGP